MRSNSPSPIEESEAKVVAVCDHVTGGGAGEMGWHHERVGVGDCVQHHAARPPIHQPGVSAAMIDMKMGAKDVIDIGECQPVGGEPVEPGLLGEIMRRPFVFAEAGVDQDGVVRCPYNVRSGR